MANPPLSGHVHDNIEKIAVMAARAEERIDHHQRRIERVTSVLGRPRTLYVTLAGAAAWILWNSGCRWWSIAPFDPAPFSLLQGLLTLFALLMTTMVLTTQNRHSRMARTEALLDLQVNLLAEQKATKAIALLEELRRDLPSVPNREDKVAEALTSTVDPALVASEIQRTLEEPPAPSDAERAR